jgi:uncharacterized protein YigE (DUF2233 family)
LHNAASSKLEPYVRKYRLLMSDLIANISRVKILPVGLVFFAVCLHAEISYTIEEVGVKIRVIEFPSEENVGFEFVSSNREKNQFYASDFYSEVAHTFIINGGYFDGNIKPVGFCQIDGELLSAEPSEKLSGYVTTTESGELSLHWKAVPEGAYRDVVQSGPFVIDPGGKIGIRTRTGKPAKRTLLGMNPEEKVFILATSEVHLYDLAEVLMKTLPDLERALNLDGGPSVARIYGERRKVNSVPVSNFLRRRK